MKVITTNLLNKFWKNGVEKKVDKSKIVQSTNITEPGFVMDGKTAADAFAELNKNILKYIDGDSITVSIGVIGYAPIPDSNIPTGHNFLFVTVRNWTSNGNSVFSVVGTGRTFFVMGSPNTTITNIRLRFWYLL